MTRKMSDYDQTQLVAIHAWKSPALGWFGRAMEEISRRVDLTAQKVLDVPGVGFVLEKGFGGLVSVLNDAAIWSVRPDAIIEDFHKHGHGEVNAIADIRGVMLKDVDETIGYLAAKYKGIALAEGAATGSAGIFGIPADIVALLALNLRAIGEYATYCGFDVSEQSERLFALNVLGLASSPSDASKQLAMAQLAKIAKEVARKKTWKQLEEHAFVQILQKIAQGLGIRLTKAKLAEAIPIVGGLVGAGFNAYYTSRVCDAAYFLYRERFLAEKYGEDVIKDAGKPADGFEPDFSKD